MCFFGLAAMALLLTGPLTPIEVYDGAWAVKQPGNAKPDHLVNHCFETEAYYTCEQTVNGRAVSLVVFTPSDQPNLFHVQNVLPTGLATGRTDLTLNGGHWTYSNKDSAGSVTTWYRTENLFSGRDRIHFEQYQSADGQHWEKKGEGYESREPAK